MADSALTEIPDNGSEPLASNHQAESMTENPSEPTLAGNSQQPEAEGTEAEGTESALQVSNLQVSKPQESKKIRSLLGRVAAIANSGKEAVTDSAEAALEQVKEDTQSNLARAGELAQQTSGLVQNAASTVQETTGNLAQNAGAAADTVVNSVASSVSSAANKTGETAGAIANSVASTVGNAASATGATAGAVATSVASGMGIATDKTGQLLQAINDNPLLQRATSLVTSDWLLGIISQVNLEKAADEVQRLQKIYPEDIPQQLARRIITQKTLYTGGFGLVSSILPGAAAATFAVDLAATTAMQAEMVYQIAMAYGLDLSEPARKGEVMAIFGLSLGGQKAMQVGGSYAARAGLKATFGNIPVAGAVIGASSNAALNYAIGYAACRFYEAKIDAEQATALESQAALEAAEQASEQYLESVLEQQRVMDQILAHAVLMAYPSEQWENIVLELEPLNLPEDSLGAIAQHLQSPEPLDKLLNQLSPDFAIPLLAQCQQIAQLDNVVTDSEQALLDQLAERQTR